MLTNENQESEAASGDTNEESECLIRIAGLATLNNFLEKLQNDPSRVIKGRKLIEKQKLFITNFKGVDIAPGVDWESNPYNNRSWQWSLNCFSFISDVIAFDLKKPSYRCITFIKSIISDWFNKYIDANIQGGFEFTWHDQATALRAEQVALVLHYLINHRAKWAEKKRDFTTECLMLLKRHGELLSKEDFYSRHTNHGLTQARVLLLLSSIFNHTEYGQRWRLTAVERLQSELDFAFTEEGVHVENSPGYHYFVFKIFLETIWDNPELRTSKMGERFREIEKKALVYLTFIIQPDGRLPIIGDTEAIRISDIFKKYYHDTIEYHNFLYSFSSGKKGICPKGNFKCYPKSGYFIYRDQWSDPEGFNKDFQLVFKAGSLSAYHKHRDEGSIVFFKNGESWLVDSGMFNYNYDHPIRKYVTSRIAHNVVHVQKSKYSGGNIGNGHNWKLFECIEDDSAFIVGSELRVYENIMIERRITIEKNNSSFKVVDNINPIDGNENSVFFIYWHFDWDKLISIENGKRIQIRSKKTGKEVILQLSCSNRFSVEKRRGVKNNKIVSVVSKHERKYHPSTLVQVRIDAEQAVEFSSTFII